MKALHYSTHAVGVRCTADRLLASWNTKWVEHNNQQLLQKGRGRVSMTKKVYEYLYKYAMNIKKLILIFLKMTTVHKTHRATINFEAFFTHSNCDQHKHTGNSIGYLLLLFSVLFSWIFCTYSYLDLHVRVHRVFLFIPTNVGIHPTKREKNCATEYVTMGTSQFAGTKGKSNKTVWASGKIIEREHITQTQSKDRPLAPLRLACREQPSPVKHITRDLSLIARNKQIGCFPVFDRTTHLISEWILLGKSWDQNHNMCSWTWNLNPLPILFTSTGKFLEQRLKESQSKEMNVLWLPLMHNRSLSLGTYNKVSWWAQDILHFHGLQHSQSLILTDLFNTKTSQIKEKHIPFIQACEKTGSSDIWRLIF